MKDKMEHIHQLIKEINLKYGENIEPVVIPAARLAEFERKYNITIPSDLKDYLQFVGVANKLPQYSMSLNLDLPVSCFLSEEFVEILLKSNIDSSAIENVEFDPRTGNFNSEDIQLVYERSNKEEDLFVLGLIVAEGGCGALDVILLNGENKGKIASQGSHTVKMLSYENTSVEYLSYQILSDSIFEASIASLSHSLRK